VPFGEAVTCRLATQEELVAVLIDAAGVLVLLWWWWWWWQQQQQQQQLNEITMHAPKNHDPARRECSQLGLSCRCNADLCILHILFHSIYYEYRPHMITKQPTSKIPQVDGLSRQMLLCSLCCAFGGAM
jgi:hypothetical protein